MNRNFYILTLKTCGIKNIERPIRLDFYKKTINNDFNPDKYKIKAVYGENGSGKTAIISSVRLLQSLLTDKNYLYDNDTQSSLLEIVNKKTKKGFIECEMYVDLDEDKQILDYYISFEIKEDGRFHITKEKLSSKNGNYSKNQYSCVFETKNGSLLKFGDKEMYNFFKEKTQNLLDKQTFLTCALNDVRNIPDSFCETNEYISQIILLLFSTSLFVCIDEEDNHSNYQLRQRLRNIDESDEKINIDTFRQNWEKIFASRGYEDTIPKFMYDEYEERISKLCLFLKIFKPELRNIEIEKKDYDEYYKCNLKMVYEDYTLDCEFESRGIKKLIKLYSYLWAANNGMIVFIDELDSNINDIYLDKIIEFMGYYGRGQLCFTSHNLSPMSVLKGYKNAICFISSINTVHTWANCGHLSPENAYKNGFVEDSPFNVDSSDFLGILGGGDE